MGEIVPERSSGRVIVSEVPKVTTLTMRGVSARRSTRSTLHHLLLWIMSLQFYELKKRKIEKIFVLFSQFRTRLRRYLYPVFLPKRQKQNSEIKNAKKTEA